MRTTKEEITLVANNNQETGYLFAMQAYLRQGFGIEQLEDILKASLSYGKKDAFDEGLEEGIKDLKAFRDKSHPWENKH